MLTDYGKVRSTLRKFGLEESIIHVWHYSRLISGNVPLPRNYVHRNHLGIPLRVEKHVFPHELDILMRELILHADRSGKPGKRSLASWDDLAEAMNAIKGFGNAVYDDNIDNALYITLHRLGHQQLPKFNKLSSSRMGKYLTLYRSSPLKEIFENKLKIGVDCYFKLTFAVLASIFQRPQINITTDFSVPGINRDESFSFFRLLTGGTKLIRERLIADQLLNSCWEYTFNALQFKPLIYLDELYPERVYCPLPPLLEARLLEGLFYDVFTRGGGFENAYGKAVEELVGRIISDLRHAYKISKPIPIIAKGGTTHGIDWMLQSEHDYVFIECKAKRISMAGKLAERIEDLSKELEHLAEAVVQNYQNIMRIVASEFSGRIGDRRLYCVVVTLEDWILFSPLAHSIIKGSVEKRLISSGLSQSLIAEIPYHVISSSTLQHCVASLKSTSISDVFSGIDNPKYDGWSFDSYLHAAFPGTKGQFVGGFGSEFEKLFDDFIDEAKSGGSSGSEWLAYREDQGGYNDAH